MIQTIVMFLWCFILSAIPFKRITFGTLYVIILAMSIHFTYNYTTELVENGIILVSEE